MTPIFILPLVKGSPVWLVNQICKVKHAKKSSLSEIFHPVCLKMTLLSLLISIPGIYGYWIITTLTPIYLQSILYVRVSQAPVFLTWTGIGAAIGYLVYDQPAELTSRRRPFALFFLGVTIVAPVFVYDATLMSLTDKKLAFITRSIIAIGVLAALLGFFTGYPSGFGAWYSELFPISICSTAVGLCLDLGRTSAILGIKLMPILVPLIGFTAAISLASVFHLIASVMVFLFQETKDVRLISDN